MRKSNLVNEKVLKEYRVHQSMRLIDFLMNTFAAKSRNNIKSLLTRRLVLVNGAPVSQFDFEVVNGDIIQISPHPVRETRQKASKLEIIYEDENFIVINKPSNLLSVASDKEKTITAYRLLSDYVKQEDKRKRIYVVHRIDKETSGVLVFVKSDKLRHLLTDGDNWNNLVKKREYIALCEGAMEKKSDVLINNLLESNTNLVYVAHGKDGHKAITKYKVVKENEKYSLLDVEIETGRKNQIRVQLKHIHHPIVGDEKYLSSSDPIHRLGLHAYKLVITNPLDNKTMTFVAKEPKEFERVFAKDFIELQKRKSFKNDRVASVEKNKKSSIINK